MNPFPYVVSQIKEHQYTEKYISVPEHFTEFPHTRLSRLSNVFRFYFNGTSTSQRVFRA